MGHLYGFRRSYGFRRTSAISGLQPLLLGLLLGTLSMGASTRVDAADTEPVPASGTSDQPGQPDTLEEVVVTGYAASLERAIADKRVADVISDGISAEDIGQFAEQNLAESLQRITGVQITRSLGDGQFISVRGLDPKFTDTLYDGRQLPSGSGTRAFDYQVLSGDFANQVDVYKSPTADMPESGLAATVNTQSIRPLDYGKEKFALTADGIYDNQAKGGLQPHAAVLYTNTFMDNRLGWIVGVDFTKRNINDQQVGSDGVNLTTSPYNGVENTAYRAYSDGAQDLVGTDQRLSAMSMIQFKVNDNLEIRLDTLQSRFEQKYDYYQGDNFFPGAGALGASPTLSQTVNANNVATVWSGSNVFGYVEGNYFDYLQQLSSTALAATLTLNSWKINAEASYGYASEQATNIYVDWQTTTGHGANLTYNTTQDPGGPISESFYGGYNPNAVSNYAFEGVQGDYKEPTSDEILNFKLDATHPLDTGWLKSVRVGVDSEDRTLATFPNYIGLTTNGFGSNINSFLMLYNNPSFFSAYSGGASVPKNFLTVNLPALLASYPLSSFVAANPALPTLTTTTAVEEKSDAAYARLDIQSPDGKWKGNLGLRAVRTEELSSGYIPAANGGLVYGLTALEYTNSALQAQSSSYNNILPDLNLSYQIADDLVARLAVARVMQRPDMNLLAAASAPSAATSVPPAGSTWLGTLSKGNPNLAPYLSNQFDLSLEWYFNNRSLLSGAFFMKDIKNFVLTNYTSETEDVTLTRVFPGSQYPVGSVVPIVLSVAQPENAQATTLKGVEIGYQEPFDFLPSIFHSLGVQANYTHIWTQDVVLNEGQPALPLTGVSNNTYNLGVYYDDSRFEVHALYNYRSEWVSDPTSYFGDGLFVKGYGQLDMSAAYHINHSMSLNASVTNLTNSAMVEVDKYGINRLYDLSGTRYYIGARVTF